MGRFYSTFRHAAFTFSLLLGVCGRCGALCVREKGADLIEGTFLRVSAPDVMLRCYCRILMRLRRRLESHCDQSICFFSGERENECGNRTL